MSLETVQKIGSLVDITKAGSGTESNASNIQINDEDEDLLMLEEKMIHGLHSCIPDENEFFSHDVNIKTSKVWFLFKFKLMGILILSLILIITPLSIMK